MDKNINYLNSKAWYRALKVFFIFVFIGVLLLANIIVFDEPVKSIDENKTLIFCNGGEKRVITAKDSKTYFSSNDFKEGFNYKKYFEGYNNYAIKQILTDCYDEFPTDDIFVVQRVYEITGFKDNRKTYKEDYLNAQIKEISSGYKTDEQKAKYLDYSTHLFDIEPHFSYWKFIITFILTNIAILVVFEILKRSFYYIALGTLRPKKNQKGQS